MKKFTLLSVLAFVFAFANAQTAEEIVEKYIEATGGQKAWEKIESIKITMKDESAPKKTIVESIMTKDGKIHETVTLGKITFVAGAYDGETAWGQSLFTMEVEMEDENSAKELEKKGKDFPNPFFPFLNYEEKGYKIELLGSETKGDVECFKIKLVKYPLLVDGEEKENVGFYYFSKEDFRIVGMQEVTTPSETFEPCYYVYDDCRKIKGVLFPTKMTKVTTEGQSASASLHYEVNFKVDESIFAFPGEK